MKYRMLKVGQQIKEGDEYKSHCNTWHKTFSAGTFVTQMRMYRRPVRERCRHRNARTVAVSQFWCDKCGAFFKDGKWQRCKRDKDGGL